MEGWRSGAAEGWGVGAGEGWGVGAGEGWGAKVAERADRREHGGYHGRAGGVKGCAVSGSRLPGSRVAGINDSGKRQGIAFLVYS